MTHSKGGVNTAFYNYAYDANSRITNVSNKDGTSAYTYDDVDQLTSANYSFQPSESYTYDLNGNRTNAGYQTGLNNRLLSDGSFNYEYDNEGNLTKQTDIVTGEVTQNTWDYRNRLTNVTRNGATVGTYTYDTYDQRIGKTANGTTERFVYGQNQNIALEFDGGGNQTHRYLHSNGIDQILADEASGTVGWTLSDHLGTVRDVVNTAGASQNHITYNSFGNVTSESNPSFDTRFSFTGREFDAETGNYDYRNRQYNPRSGRFIEEDPIGFNAGDTNLYRYVRNSSPNFVDPKGYLQGVPFPVPVRIPVQIPFAPLFAPLIPFLQPLLFPDPAGDPAADERARTIGRPLLPRPVRPIPSPQETPEIAPPLLQPKGPNPNSCECEEMKKQNAKDGKVIFFGQKRISPVFNDGRPITLLKEQLEKCQVRPNDIKFDVFRDPFGSGRLVSAVTRRLAAFSLAGLRPTNIRIISINDELRKRINEDPVPGFPRLPSHTIPATRRPDDLRVLFPITIPGY